MGKANAATAFTVWVPSARVLSLLPGKRSEGAREAIFEAGRHGKLSSQEIAREVSRVLASKGVGRDEVFITAHLVEEVLASRA